ncbi:hypothetical protein PtA15_1A24 [Puccinia triticina]|uniref:Secreted protein n=1 Tax=Puccinia triticina TaxID=208348 RepID=A0ABY7C6H2_9BASI|nr:uncharacterized protein PtA15_1A24 [Puccinia triticina]WAQ80686.1 hypothetical protein PtA15_1A24 [Puccinia triticina]WAR51577.1 hypothetical protein PtB15_1B13 [Puccinia triticina]
MAFFRDLMSALVVSILVRTVIGETTNTLDVNQQKVSVTKEGGSAASSSSADNSGELSATCHNAIATMVEVRACAGLADMVQIRMATESVSTPIKAWLTSMCKVAACSPASLQSATEKFLAGCATEISSGSTDAEAFYSLLTNYKTIRAGACLNIEKLDFCVSALAGPFKKCDGRKRTLFSVPKAAYCIECGAKIHSNNTTFCEKGDLTASPVPINPILVALPAPKEAPKPQSVKRS